MQCELLWFLEIVQPHLLSGGQGGNAGEQKDTQDKGDPFANSDLYELLNATVERARQRGLEKLDEMKAKALAISLQAGAGQAHRAQVQQRNRAQLRRVQQVVVLQRSIAVHCALC